MEEIISESNTNNFEAWFYPEYKGVKGFLGTQDMILLGLNPSSGTFPSRKDKILYELLIKKSLKNIHISDFIKIRAKNKEVPNILNNNELIKEQIGFLKKELEIIKPKIIIPMGLQCEELLKENFPYLDCEVIRIKHYGFRYKPQKEVFDEISSTLDKIREVYKTIVN